MRTPVISTELLASRRPFSDGIYIVGSFAARVSFASQQRRVLSLVCGIDDDLKKAGKRDGLDKTHVCIVGAGLAGLTCALAVAALGGKAQIIEANDAPMQPLDAGDPRWPDEVKHALFTVRGASHRDAHPTANSWPQEPLEPVTRLPLMNWHEGDCYDVASQIGMQFVAFSKKDKFGNRIRPIRHGYRLKAITPTTEKDERRWRVECEPDKPGVTPPPRDKDTYDIVILSVGFGLEKGVAGQATPSYWDAEGDCVPAVRNSPNAFDNFIVSGTGDGGLIEALRLIFNDVRAGSIDRAVMGALTDPNFRDKTLAIENRAHKMYVDNVLHDGGLPILDSNKDEISQYLWEKYTDLVENEAGVSLLRMLCQRRSPVPHVILMGQRPSPLELGAAPYHRLLITLAIGMGFASFVQVKGDIAVTEVSVR